MTLVEIGRTEVCCLEHLAPATEHLPCDGSMKYPLAFVIRQLSSPGFRARDWYPVSPPYATEEQARDALRAELRDFHARLAGDTPESA